ncbi:MAG: hypothetical protein KKF68_02575 [Nanoarchaeota archaeon]|nr:hypothetical protein [Nanoarchaeota archaeon]
MGKENLRKLSRRRVLQLLGLAGSAGIAAACDRTRVKDLVYGVEFGSKNNTEFPYEMERNFFYEKPFYVAKDCMKEGTEGFVFVPFEESSRVITKIGENGWDVSIEAPYFFVPKNTGEKEVKLRIADSPDLGLSGLKARITKLPELKERENIKRRYGFKVKTTEQDARWNIETVNILGREYFFPHFPKKDLSEKTMDFALIPTDKTDYKIANKDGQVTLVSDEIYRPIRSEHPLHCLEGQKQIKTPAVIEKPTSTLLKQRREIAPRRLKFNANGEWAPYGGQGIWHLWERNHLDNPKDKCNLVKKYTWPQMVRIFREINSPKSIGPKDWVFQGKTYNVPCH